MMSNTNHNQHKEAALSCVCVNGFIKHRIHYFLCEIVRSASHVQDRLDIFALFFRNEPAGLISWYCDDLDAALPGLSKELRHNWQLTVGACTDDQVFPAPGDFFINRQRCVAILFTICLGDALESFFFRLWTLPLSMTTSKS